MSIEQPEASRPLPDRPNLRHLKDQAKDLLEAGAAASTADAQFKIARRCGFASGRKLKAPSTPWRRSGNSSRPPIPTTSIAS